MTLHELVLVIREHLESMRRPTSYVAAALTRARQARLPSPWTGRGIWIWTRRRNQKNHKLYVSFAENPAGRQSAGILRKARGE
jgi:hypothetical protein